jgi:hypothetical protein
MTVLRAFLLRHYALAALVLVAALCLKAIVPAGYMVGQADKVMTVLVCDPAGSTMGSTQITVAVKGEPAKHAGASGAQGDCAYTSLAMASLAGADPLLLALALAFVLALGVAAVPLPAPTRTPHVRPPLRGPPALA